MSTERPTVTVAATIKSKAEMEDGYAIELLIPTFGSDYPTKVSRVLVEMATRLMTGKTYTLTLERQNVRKKADGTPYDGSKPWMWWYGLKDVPDQQQVTPEVVPAPSREERALSREERTPDRQDLIMLQHASAVAAQAYGDWMCLPPGTRGTFSDYLKSIALAATWYLHQVYQKGGYALHAPQRGTGDTGSTEPDVETNPDEDEAF